jgi:hypothetical protein
MNGEIGTYTFLPWLRQGIANRIQSADHDPSVVTRALITLNLNLKGTGGEDGDQSRAVPRTVSLYGPGDIVGIDSQAIIKTEPENWITNFEPNYLPYVEFYDEDFPWRYTPAAPSGARLRPWLTLIVLTEEEFVDGQNLIDKPLPFIEITAGTLESVFPKAEELWAWAHAHINTNLVGSADAPQASDTDAVIAALDSLLKENPDMAYSRITCPRKLNPNTRYHAFLIPTFETGRLAGLGLDPTAADHATYSSWGPGRSAPTQFPFYFRWFFRTGSRGDFEYLVRLLEPKPADSRVGRRDIDVQHPGSNIAGITDPELEGVLKLGGALLAPLSDEAETELQKWEEWDQPYPHQFQEQLAQFLNFPDDYAIQSAAAANSNTDLDPAIQTDPDPLITAPIYGRWHALLNRVLYRSDGADAPNNTNWMHELNLDPRWRCSSGFGTDVIIDNQEEYMDAAWDQVGDVIEANRRIRFAQFARQSARYWYEMQLKPMQSIGGDKIMHMTAPLQKRILHQGMTVYHQVNRSPVTPAVTSAPLRRMVRPHARLHKYSNFDATNNINTLVTRVNSGEVTAAPEVTVPPDIPTLDDVADDLLPDGVPSGLIDLLSKYPWLRFVPLVIALLVILILLLAGAPVIAWIIGVAAIAGLVWLTSHLRRWAEAGQAADSIREEGQTPESVDALPSSAEFVLTPHIDLRTLDINNPLNPATLGGEDSPQSKRFKLGLADAYATLQTGQAVGLKPDRVPINIQAIANASIATIDPMHTISRYTMGQVLLPSSIIDLIGEIFVEAMAYPEFDIPMYEPLVNKSTELFVPNLNYVEPNSITLLNTNQRFIESYMVGLNHEFARELLWREYPTDQRGSYFRQFWDVSSFLSETEDREQRREELKDIPPLHLWSKHSDLGDHDHREQGLDNEEELVLVIRGELLKKYPNAVIYAHKAMWQPKSETDPSPDKTKERDFDPNEPIKSPIYEAKVKPDIYFFGFDLTEDEARGDASVDDEPGWFFVIKERPGEPRFGLDIEREGPLQVWNDLAWPDVVPGVADGDFIDIASAPHRTLPNSAPSGTAQEKAEQWAEDHLLAWGPGISAAELAYILFQAPVLVGVHASEMLPD